MTVGTSVALKKVSGVITQAQTIAELQENIRDAYQLVTDDTPEIAPAELELKEI